MCMSNYYRKIIYFEDRLHQMVPNNNLDACQICSIGRDMEGTRMCKLRAVQENFECRHYYSYTNLYYKIELYDFKR